ncbi:MAG: phosphoglucosamine mutase [Oscillospiraceae bacterium]|nr:phosphoglucosamine mutase [Oscillospiraceae bacterium]
MGRLFGTDGARGIAITELTCETAMNIGRAAALVLTKTTNKKPKILIGKDTRVSGDVLEAALVAGICSVGADAHILGVVPTPAVAMLVKKYEADAGVMISASHNPVEFNGIKLFSGEGFKLPDAIEKEIEDLVLDNPSDICLSSGTLIGRVVYEKNAEWDYVRYIMKNIDGDFRGLKVAIDCANGASSSCAEKLFKGMGANCVFVNNTPDGTNINKDCGSLYMDKLCRTVVDNKCHLGLAFDGDADRCIACDEKGNVIDGDKLLAIFSRYMKAQGKLRHNACVVTVMTNLGFFKFAKESGVIVATTGVGDRYVLEEMLRGGYNLGGEQSGHIIFLDEANTGDGELTGAKLLEIMAKTKARASDLAGIMSSYPQILINVEIPADKKGKWEQDEEISKTVEMYKTKLGDDGRILIRESGTEPLVRVMIEGKSNGIITEYATNIANKIREFAQA